MDLWWDLIEVMIEGLDLSEVGEKAHKIKSLVG